MTWYAGDLHVHTTYSSDVSDDPMDDNFGYTPAEQIAQAESVGLKYLALTDHASVSALSDPGYHSALLTLVPGYEHYMDNFQGHAGVLGVDEKITYPTPGDAEALAFRGYVNSLGGIMIANHPRVFQNWAYDGQDVRPDGVEVWNLAHSATWLDNWPSLNWYRDVVIANHHRVAMVGGSDLHVRATGRKPGYPCTWIDATSNTVPALLAAIKAGKTVITKNPPGLDGLGIKAWMFFDTSTTRYDLGQIAPAGGIGTAKMRVVNALDAYCRFVVDGVKQPSIRADSNYYLHQANFSPTQHVRGEVWRGTASGDDVTNMYAMTSPIYFS